MYYEEKLGSVTLQFSTLTNQSQNLTDEVSSLKQDRDKILKEKSVFEREVPVLIKEKKKLEKKLEKLVEKSEKLERECMDEKEMTKSLLTKQQYLQEQLEAKDSQIRDFEEQVRDLMFFFSAQEKMKENPELAGGHVVVPENSNTGSTSTRKKKGKK